MEIVAQEVKRAEALADQARATWLPTLNGNAVYTRLDNDRELNGRVILSANQFNANLALNAPLVAPRAWIAHARTKDGIELAKLSAVDARREIALATGRAYLTVIAQHRVLKSAERALVTAKAHEDFTKTRFEGGVGNRLDAVRASQERNTAEARVRTQEVALARAQEALGILVGEQAPIDASGDPALPAPPTEAAAMGEVNTRRADVIANRERVEVTRKAVRDSWADYMPLLSLIAQPFYQNPATFTQPTTGWQAQLVLSLPIFDGGNRYGLADERRALHEQARTRLESGLRTARSEVRIAFEAMKRADDALALSRDAATLAREALELAALAYKAGATSNIEVVDAERRAHEAETQAAVAEDAARQARLDLLGACGRFP